eukprot:299447-Chlamydomonas_euryale.AAC.6
MLHSMRKVPHAAQLAASADFNSRVEDEDRVWHAEHRSERATSSWRVLLTLAKACLMDGDFVVVWCDDSKHVMKA